MAKRRKVRRKPIIRRRRHDPFEVVGKIRAGVSYQWVACSIMGDKALAAPVLEQMNEGGWRPVKPWRHPRMKKSGGKIVVRGQILMERPEQVSVTARLEETTDAIEMVKQSPLDPRKWEWGDERRWRAFNSEVIAPVSVSKEDIELAAEKLSHAQGQRYCRINVPVTVSDSEIEMALYLKLDPAEYVRRRVVMDTEALVKRTVRTPEKEHLFSRAEFQAKTL